MLEYLKDKRVLLLGWAATNRAFYARLRQAHPDMPIGIADQKEDIDTPDDPNTTTHLGPTYLDQLSDWDIIVRTPGVPYSDQLKAVKERVTTATNLFFHEVRASTNARLIGITGTKGKSTTSTLIYDLLKAAGYDTMLLGNINIQDWDLIDTVTDDSWIVYELSSYMLQDFSERPDIAVLTAIFPDHLNWHEDYGDYVHAKARITTQQTKEDLLIFNAVSEESVHIMSHSEAFRLPYKMMNGLHVDTKWFYSDNKELFPSDIVPLPGRHNKDNVLAMMAVAKALEIDWKTVEGVIKAFKGLPHRLEHIGTYKDIAFYDDALSTTPDSTVAAIQSFSNLGSIILGGLDRGYDFSDLAQELTERKIPAVTLFPGARRTIEDALKTAGYAGHIEHAENMEEAVTACYKHTPKDHVCLLSTATPSFDLFKNYEDQGEQFKTHVQQQS